MGVRGREKEEEEEEKKRREGGGLRQGWAGLDCGRKK